MAVELIIAPEAAQDADEAYSWYELQRRGLGEEFFGCLEAAFEFIQRNPLMSSLVANGYRRKLLRRFPYAVFYEFNEPYVIVYCVFHTARNPKTLRRRLGLD